jgi:hypothetical protein
MLQDSQICAGPHGRRVFLAQPIVSLAKAAGREQILAIAIILKGAWLAHQLIDDMSVVDRMLVATHQPRQRVHAASGVPDFHTIRVQPGLHVLADQAAVDRVHVAMNVNQAPRIYTDRQPQATVQSLFGQRLQDGQFFQVPLPAWRVALVQQFPQERAEVVVAGEVPTATQLQGLVQGVLEVTMGRLGVAVLVWLPNIDPLTCQPVTVQKGAVTRLEFPLHRQIVDRCGQTIAPMPPRHAAQLPQRVLQSVRQGLERLRGTQRHRFPVRVGQHEVIRQLLEPLAGNGDSQGTQLGEVGSGQVPGMMHLAEHHLPGGTEGHSPVVHTPFQRPTMTVGKLPRMPLFEPVEKRLRLQGRLVLKQRFHLRPHLGERILPRPIRPRLLERAGQPPRLAILPCRLLVHTRPPGRNSQLPSCIQVPPQLPYLTVRDHRNPPGIEKLRVSPIPQIPGILIVAGPTPSPSLPPAASTSFATQNPGFLIVAGREK